MTHLYQRLLISSAGICLVFLTIYFSYTPSFSLLVPMTTGLVFGLALKEYYQISKKIDFNPQFGLGMTLSTGYLFLLYFLRDFSHQTLLPLLFLSCSLFSIFSFFLYHGKDPFRNSAITLFGICYLTLPLSCTLQINYFFPSGSEQDGRWWIFYLLSLTYVTDTGGYFFGKVFGKRKLAPFTSPQKTWAGAVGGLVMAVFISLLFYLYAKDVALNFYESLYLGLTISILSQVGDLAESLLKRDAKVKDSSTIPGMGGLLDVVDSLILPTPFLFIYLTLINQT